MLCSCILKFNLVLPHQDGTDTAIKSRSTVEILFFIALGLEEKSQN